MMSIGEFSQASGLSAKTLRFYDERGLLTPAYVDPHSGYRHYTAHQLRAATTIRLLRASGMSLSDVHIAVEEPDRLDDLLAAHRSALIKRRATEDLALTMADRFIPELEQDADIRTRSMPATHWAGLAMTMNEAQDSSTEECNELFAQLYNALVAAGNPPVGPFWTTLPQTEDGELVLCWPVATEPSADFVVPGAEVRTGTLPARTEAYVRWPMDRYDGLDLDEDEIGPITNPAFIAFAEYVEEHVDGCPEVRQVGVLDEQGLPWAVDISATISVDG